MEDTAEIQREGQLTALRTKKKEQAMITLQRMTEKRYVMRDKRKSLLGAF